MMKFIPKRFRITAAVFIALTFVCAASGHAADPDALWKIVHDRCLQNEEAHNNPAPCAKVDLGQGADKGYSVLKDLYSKTQFLLIPTARITGIESPLLLAPDATNYFQKAWEARSYVAAAAPRALRRDEYSLAINSVYGRTQDQLHIHIDCINAYVRKTLKAREASIGEHWAPLDAWIFGHRYWAMRVNAEQLDTVNPFRLLAAGVPGAGAAMGRHTLVVAGETFNDGRNGFILLDDRTELWTLDLASGEELQDHTCSAG